MSDYGQGGGGFGQPPGQPPGGGGFGQPPGGGGFGQPPGGGGFGQPPGQPPGGGGFGQPPGSQPGFGPQPGGYGHPPAGFNPMSGQPPQDYKTAGVLMLVSGITNIIASAVLILVLVWICIGAFWFLTLAGAIFELIVAVSVMQGQRNHNAKTAAIIGLVTSVLCGNMIGIGCEIFALVTLGKPEVDAFLRTG
jgi:hypothetical protein